MSVQLKLREALALHQRGEIAGAQRLYEEILAVEPRHGKALHLLGVIAAQAGNPRKALEMIDQALAIDPGDPMAHYNRGTALQALQNWQDSLASYDRALAFKPDYAEAFLKRGAVLRELHQWDAALASYERAASIKPHLADAYWYLSRGSVLQDLRRFDAALLSYGQAVALRPDYAEAYCHRGTVLMEMNALPAALASFEQAIALKSHYADAHSNRGAVLTALKQWDAALASCNQAIALDPHIAEAYAVRGALCAERGQWQTALESYDLAIAIRPGFGFLLGDRAFARMQLCDWDGLDAELPQLIQRIERGAAACAPLPILALSGSAALQRQAAQIWVQNKYPPDPSLGPLRGWGRHERIRVGYFSPDFRDHAVSHLTAHLFESHDRSRFDVTGFSFGPDTQDPMRRRMERAFERFLDVREQSDRDIALLARSMELDIAVDLAGFTRDCRPAIFALRAAPLQVSYLGYLGTMAAPYMDYLIADGTTIPLKGRAHYAERILCLPSYQVNDSTRGDTDKTFTREQLRLPPAGFVFCCFNANHKMTRTTFAGWMRMLLRVPGSVLFLLAANPAVMSNLRQEAAYRGIDPDRLVFGGMLPRADYLARFRAADLFLDTLPYNAGTTASDALWAGLPVVTCTGETFAGRVAASLLTALKMPELIASTQAQYEDLAVELATDPERLAKINQQLSEKRLTAPLFNTRFFTTHLEAAYTKIHARLHGGLPTADIEITSC
jgi:predicted O-linked N-acetylglucosamine transferase (SPINDLY family)